MVTQLNKSSWIRGGGVRPTHFPPMRSYVTRGGPARGPMWHVYGGLTEMITVRTYKTYGVSKLNGQNTWQVLSCYGLLLYMDGNIRRQTADTNIDGNDVYVTNTDENTFDDTIRGNKYLSLLIPTKFIRLQRSEVLYHDRTSNRKFENPTSDYREFGYLATSRGCWPGSKFTSVYTSVHCQVKIPGEIVSRILQDDLY